MVKPDSGTINTERVTLVEFQKKLTEEKNNSITAVYSLQKDEESVFFNPKNIGLSDKNYEIEIISVKDEYNNSAPKTLRHLEDISYKFLSQINGKIEIRISFFIALTSMFELFKGCKNLIEIDLSKLDASNLKDLDSAFENCPNLKFANLNLPNGKKIQSMDNSFNGCQKLENVDLTEFEPNNNVSIQNMFKNCANLNYVDLSNFHSYNFGGIFVGCLNMTININTHENSKQDIYYLINNGEETKVECEIGPGPKCKQCMEGKNSIYCDDCNERYYIPYKKKRTECIKCENNCLECFGLVTFSHCYKCEKGYEAINGKCQKLESSNEEPSVNKETNKNEPNESEETNKIESKESEKIDSNDSKETNKNEANETIKIGPNEPKEIDTVESSENKATDKNEPRETDNYEPKETNKNVFKTDKIDSNDTKETNKPNCITGEEEKCKSCDLIQSEYCGECNEGYYLSEEDKTKCMECSTIYCKLCLNDICTECFDDYEINYEVNYPDLTDQQAFDKIFKEMELRDTFINKVYCQKHNPEKPPNDFSMQIHFVWNKYKRKMIAIEGIYFISDSIARITNNEYLQSVIQGYEFTYIDHIYQRDNKKYKYNDQTLKFDEIPDSEEFDIQCLKNETNVPNKKTCDIGE